MLQPTQPSAGKARLKRSLGLGLLVLYGVGVIIGAGIYVLTGQVAGAAGMAAALSFLLAAPHGHQLCGTFRAPSRGIGSGRLCA